MNASKSEGECSGDDDRFVINLNITIYMELGDEEAINFAWVQEQLCG